jgi:hypothetical protein
VQQNREFESSQEKNLEAAPGRGTASMGIQLIAAAIDLGRYRRRSIDPIFP